MYENSLEGIIPDSIQDLVYLVAFNIFNDGREYEYATNVNRNTIYKWNSKIHSLEFLEEINFVNLEMFGTLDSTLTNLQRLRVLNISKNNMTGTIPDNFDMMPDLEVLELGDNRFEGSIPSTLIDLTKLRIVTLNDNKFTGTIPIFQSEMLAGLDFTNNSLSGSFPEDYFVATSYHKLEYVNANFNGFEVPDH